MRKGFTLIELLAVIVILAIIATIAVPIVLSIIEDAKESTTLRNAEYYLDAVEQSIAKKSLNTGSAYQPTECEIQEDGNLVCDGEVEVIVEVKGKKPSNGTITFEEGKMINISLTIENKVVIQNENNELVIGESNNSICTLKEGEPNAIGSKYQCKVKEDMEEGFEDGYYFFVLSNEDDGTTNLIMERNIYYDSINDVGMVATEENKGLVQWKEGYTVFLGPVTAMDYLYSATKDWSNVTNIVMNYTDEGNTGNYGYGTITTIDNITKITAGDGSAVTVLTDKEGYTNLKARMPKYSEVSSYDSTNKTNSYLYNYLNLSGTIQANSISGIKGYWTLASTTDRYGDPVAAWTVNYGGDLANEQTGSKFGVRPVINVKLSAIEKPTNPKPPTVDEPTEPPVLSNFTFEGVSYQFEEGMTWFDWLSSDYNTDDFYADGSLVRYVSYNASFWAPNGTDFVRVDDMIIAGASYSV